MMENIRVDALGDQCPIPVVKTLKAIDALTSPATIETHVDNEIAVQNLMRLASGRNAAFRSEQLSDKHFVTYIEAEPSKEQSESTEPVECIPDRRRNTVVAITSSTMGHGNEELGKVLIKGFLYALSQLDELPKTLLFYNGGVRLTTEGSQSLEDLKNMEAQGVEILSCGTCLDYYGLKEKLCVGSVTNMYNIVEALNKADKIIKP